MRTEFAYAALVVCVTALTITGIWHAANVLSDYKIEVYKHAVCFNGVVPIGVPTGSNGVTCADVYVAREAE